MDSYSQQVLDAAGSRLTAVSRADPAGVTPAMRLSCLWAIQLLEAAGARTAIRSGDNVGDPATSIRAALALIAMLPVDVFGQHDIVEAAAVARAAPASAG